MPVTGGSTGIGWEICRQMLDAARGVDVLDELGHLRQLGVRADPCRADDEPAARVHRRADHGRNVVTSSPSRPMALGALG